MASVDTPRRPFQIDFPGFDITADDTVVDVGCGDGSVCTYAGHQGADVIGLDIEPTLIETTAQAMEGVPARSFRGIISDADPIPLPDGTASVVVATEVLEHVDDPVRIMSELVRIGKPGARYLISVPDPASESVMKVVAPRWYFEKPLHVRILEHDELDRLCTDAGLVVESRRASGFFWSLWWISRMSIGMGHKYDETPDHDIFGHLDGLFNNLLATPTGAEAIQVLDRLLPKSQVILARKRGRPFHRPWARLRQRLRVGSIRFGGIDLSWRIRRLASGTTPA
jgi:SAM-dependent methyltransferase